MNNNRMRIPRIYYPKELRENSKIKLTAKGFNHLKVLKLNKGNKVEIFNGKGKTSIGVIEYFGRDELSIRLNEKINQETEIFPEINLGVSNIRNFDKVVKDSSQMGVKSLTSLITSRTKLRNLNEEKVTRWNSISSSSCEQSGLNWIPKISQMKLEHWAENSNNESRYFLDPRSKLFIGDIKEFSAIDLVIGPEGGFSSEEESFLTQKKFTGVNCGNLIIKTESMPIVVLSMLKVLSGAI